MTSRLSVSALKVTIGVVMDTACTTAMVRSPRARAFTVALVLFMLSAALLPATWLPAQDPLPKGWRIYEDGPLKEKDFTGQPEAGSIRAAFTVPRLHWTMRYEIEKRTSTSVTLSAIEISVWAVVVQHESWLRPGIGLQLLDHEQGHFDVCQAAALEARLKIRQLELQRRSPVGRGADLKSADEDLRRQINAQIQPIFEASMIRQREYDQFTDHGEDAARQKESRATQLEAIAQFKRQLKTAGAKEQPRPLAADAGTGGDVGATNKQGDGLPKSSGAAPKSSGATPRSNGTLPKSTGSKPKAGAKPGEKPGANSGEKPPKSD